MRKLSIFIILFFCLLTVRAQQVSLQDVANRTYRAEGIRGIKPMLDGEHYTQMSADGKKIILQPERRFDERPHLQEPARLYAAHSGVVPLPAAL